ncbi:MAG: cold shock domain-containing protein [Sporocytophaga sp.]|uniref:cold-shock protein n=1 Tax=Sporocytophaga sp. TaxID=2231183 RepID=UPI001B07CF5B|nr:cold shock domain-containing protein [Sporocytophaga sp.]MBO9699866.1 cold shock domain-containing protein [Sporocytophaga sp.]
MGKSQETFNKKEVEKKKQQKKKEKEEKSKERKAHSNKGQSLEDMMAYVDENGNITSVPPDPNKKKTVINQDDIQIGVARNLNRDEPKPLRKGKVTFFNESKGYGFIKDLETQESIFVHINGIKEPIKENDRVTFETINTPKGLNAVSVKKS